MKFRTILSICMLSLAIAACKKDEEEKTSEFMSGSISISIPEFVLPGYEIKASDITQNLYAKGTEIGFFITDPYTGKKDTTIALEYSKLLPFIVKDTLGSFDFTCTGFAEGFYNSSATTTFNTVDPEINGSLKGLGIDERKDSSFLDVDGRKYYFTPNKGLYWMMQNLANESAGVPYKYCNATSYMFGVFYTWEEAISICPEGWRLPTAEEWSGFTAGEIMADATFNGEKMWPLSPDVPISGSARLCAIPCGYAEANTDGYRFKGFNSYAAFWTSTQEGDQAVYKYIYSDLNDIQEGLADKNSFAASVRCVRQ